ncbi:MULTISPECIES: ABC transporter ATP-binding protein [Clostridium]|uniref:ABC transporter ATP-binding protein n=2 Tax=Clostridium cadaveris TaxID=1529 RepID=A0A1I2M499_9CLOT|nr:ABC transporter ATP-binding protein [Clostridium cadaveris]MDU4953270.1 ABC transporter ATP-binding protein [Clostridium sp.]PWL51609.1 MAG: ABC transporter ATP-binding protein [Clostridium cadaveris]UFH64948.1 ABC transporter ATP-binding protein [Clostridium cadaveris]SFF86293.1 ABC-type lipoprotein export system, ATPase component [Clostridium cadaveris]
MSNIIECENLIKIYKTADLEVVALQGLDLIVEEGELTAIIGNSGSGKSTLLNMIGCLDTPSAGKLFVDGKDLFKLTKKEIEIYKRETVGFVWQNNARNLIPYLTAAENIELALSIGGKSKDMRNEALKYLDMTGIVHRKNSKLSQLSGGEQQRVAIAIALCNNPKLLLADEPTGSVDSKTASMILDLFRELNNTLGLTILIVTHDRQLSAKVQRVVAIRDGKTSSEFIRKDSYAQELQSISQGLTLEGNEETHEELMILDRAGRFQIPHEYLDSLKIKGNKIKVELDGGKIVITNPQQIEKVIHTEDN